MSSQLIGPLITGFITLFVCFVNTYAQGRKTREDFKTHSEKTEALIEYKLDELTKRVDKHNNVVERVFGLEKAVSIIEEKQKVANNRIEDLEEGFKGD